MTQFHIRSAFFGGCILHTVEITRETLLYAPDLRGISLENAELNGADLHQWVPQCPRAIQLARTSPMFSGEHMNQITFASIGRDGRHSLLPLNFLLSGECA
jgi:hypothetical protein